MVGELLRQQRQVAADLRGVNSARLDAFSADPGHFGGIALDHINSGLAEQLQAFPVAQGGGARAADIEDHRDAFLVGAAGGELHGFNKLNRQRADIQHQGGGDLGHFGGFLPGMGHHRRRAKGLDHLRAIVNRDPVRQVVDHGLLLTDSVQ